MTCVSWLWVTQSPMSSPASPPSCAWGLPAALCKEGLRGCCFETLCMPWLSTHVLLALLSETAVTSGCLALEEQGAEVAWL